MRKENKYGFIEYRMPTVRENMLLLHCVGINAETANQDWMKNNFMLMLSNMVENISPMIEKVEMKYKEKEISTYEELIKHGSLMMIVQEVCMDIFAEITGGNQGN